MGEVMYAPLHVHTEFSTLDGIVKIPDYIQKVKEYGLPACAVTDHGSLGGVVKFYLACRKEGIKPIIGLEAYIVDDVNTKERDMAHIVLLAKNEKGYRNLLKINNISFKYFYYKPRIDYKILAEYSEGLICMSACLAGHIPFALLNGEHELARKYTKLLLDIFGSDFYLELQDNNLSEQQIVNSYILSLAKELGVPVVGTSDIHYLNEDDHLAHLAVLAIQTKKTLNEIQAEKNFSGFVNSSDFYLKSYDDFLNRFSHIPEAVSNTLEIADKCNLVIPELEDNKILFPALDLPDSSPEEMITKLTKKALLKLGLPVERYEKYYERLNYELSVINKLGFATYFLVLKDVIDFCKREGIRYGWGRGSAAGALVSYLLGITKVDPLKHGLLFERFLNPDRISPPDIDLDFAKDRRSEVVQYLYNKYGKDKVCHIGTYDSLSLKAVIKDVARVLGVDFNMANNITKNMVDDSSDLSEIEKDEFVSNLYTLLDKEIAEKLLSISKKLFGLRRHPSIHAAGVVVSPISLDDIVPIRLQDGEVVTQWEMEDIESAGLIKFDILGLRTLTVVEECAKMCNIDLDKIPFDDEKAWQLIRSGNTVGCFQFESPGIRKLLKDMQASVFEDLEAINALFRPGPLDSRDEQGKTMVEYYVDRKLGLEPVKYDHPLLEPILKSTYGVFVYQEQLMQAARELAGYTMSDSDELRKIVGKKVVEKIPEQKKKFIEGCIKNNIEPEVAERIFSKIETFGRYGFNKSHSCAYSYLSYITAYLKANYPLQYMTCVLNSVIDKQDKIVYYLQECIRMGLKILPPDINKSYGLFTIEDGAIRYGLGAIKKVSTHLVESLIKERQKKPFSSLKDLITRVNRSILRKDVLLNLICAGACDSIEPNESRLNMCKLVEEIYEFMSKQQQKLKKGKITEDVLVNMILEYEQKEVINDNNVAEVEKLEKEVLGLPLLKYFNMVEKLSKLEKKCPHRIDDILSSSGNSIFAVAGIVEKPKDYVIKSGKYKGQKIYTFFLSDLDSVVKCIIYPSQNIKTALQEGDIIVVKGKKNVDKDGKIELIVNQLRKF